MSISDQVKESVIDMEILTALGCSGIHDCCLYSGWGRSENPAERKMDTFCEAYGACKSNAMRAALNEEIRLLDEARARGESPNGSAGALLDRARARMWKRS